MPCRRKSDLGTVSRSGRISKRYRRRLAEKRQQSRMAALCASAPKCGESSVFTQVKQEEEDEGTELPSPVFIEVECMEDPETLIPDFHDTKEIAEEEEECQEELDPLAAGFIKKEVTDEYEDHLTGPASTADFSVETRKEKLLLISDHPVATGDTQLPLGGATGDCFPGEGGAHNKLACNKTPQSQDLVKRMRKLVHNIVVGKLHPCSVCKKTFREIGNLKTHMQTHTQEKPVACGVCEMSFIEKAHLDTHMHTHNKMKRYKCTFCSESFVLKRHIDAHMRAHATDSRLTCLICNLPFTERRFLDAHMQAHTGKKTHICSICGAANSKSHICFDTEEVICKICHKTFKRKTSLIEHMRLHTGEKPHVCTICASAFTRKRILIEHMRVHTGEKPYTCSVCERAFAFRNDFVTHMRTHFGKYLFACTICRKRFTKKRKLDAHVLSHTPHACMTCNKAFATRWKLRSHVRTHTGEKR